MRYWQGDFHCWKKDILFPQYTKEGKYVYTLHDEGGRGYTIRRGLVNRFGYMITDEPLPEAEMTDAEFFMLNPIEDDTLKETNIDLSNELKEAQKAYVEKQRLFSLPKA